LPLLTKKIYLQPRTVYPKTQSRQPGERFFMAALAHTSYTRAKWLKVAFFHAPFLPLTFSWSAAHDQRHRYTSYDARARGAMSCQVHSSASGGDRRATRAA